MAIDSRLITIGKLIRSGTHADIGADHGYLMRGLLAERQIQRGVAVELSRSAFERCRKNLLGWDVDVRLGDGLQPLGKGEVDSVSLCGMGAGTIVKILSRDHDKIPESVVVQPNKQPERIRRWAIKSGYQLDEETVHTGFTCYQIMRFCRKDSHVISDAAYAGMDLTAALLFGPINIRRGSADFLREMERERSYLTELPYRSVALEKRLDAVNGILSFHQR